MTACKVLAETSKAGKTITACQKTNKHAVNNRYEIVISENGYAVNVISAAKTTWKAKFHEIQETL